MLPRVALLLCFVSLAACSSTRVPTEGSVEFDEITVRRINVVGPDGSYRVVLAAEDRFPAPVIDGREQDRAISPAGLVFYGLDGDEVGAIAATGDSTQHNAMLVFDYANVDGPRLFVNDRGENGYMSGFAVNDRPPLDTPIAGAPPVRVGAAVNNGTSYVVLNDANGKERLVLTVSAEGEAKILFLDASGSVTRTISATETVTTNE